METRDYNKSDFEIISVDDLDGVSQKDQKERNIIREKTFNSELHSLVNQIYLNEEINDKQLNYSDDISVSEMDSMLEKCESLIYRLKHFNDLPAVSSSYNPFKRESYSSSFSASDDELADDLFDINEGLAQCGFLNYQILQYNFSDKAYRSSSNNLDPYFADAIFFSIDDHMILHINENAEGLIIKPDLINSDPFFTKKFIRNGDKQSDLSSFYIVKISSIFTGLIDSHLLDEYKNNFEHFFSPLLLIELNHGEILQAKDIFKKLKEFTAAPFLTYFFKNSIKSSIKHYSFEDVILIIELFVKLSSHLNLTPCLITLKDYSVKENIFILKFIISKIKRFLKKESLIFRVSINKIIFILSEFNIDDIRNIIDKVNSTDEVIKVQIINNDYINNKELIDFLLS